ncbi:MAG: hypothetical protein Solivirus9_5 [Solivirus sp.]|uniref:Lipocalin/cytosolic fatty-acid binding domain-containing protein n=1 Tax=Solivirus sp. TaxID=2487772 RepID=A0A3G5AHR3_9VIRU|nr:MAG: hypothetical protein Solivirus9_5 [Solivirus sp.]
MRFNAERYSGRWYQVGKYPFYYEPEACAKSYTDYKYNAQSGTLSVHNFCTGPDYLDEVEGLLWNRQEDEDTGKFQVQFFRFDSSPSDYIILDTDYTSYSLVGNSEGTLFWILSRTPKIEKRLLNRVLGLAQYYGYNIDLLEFSSDSLQ